MIVPSSIMSDLPRRERRAMLLWTTAIVAMLVFGVALSVGGAMIALHGRPMVEEEYYNKALHWDDHLALVQASRALGWKTELSVGNDTTTGGERALMIRLLDKSGTGLEGAIVSVAFFHRARPLDLVQMELKGIGGGLYAGSAKIDRAGIWEFRLTVQRKKADGSGEDMYIESLQRDLLE